MKVYIITYVDFPKGMAASKRIACYARSIKESGVDCEVIIYYRTECSSRPYGNDSIKGIYKGVPYQYITGVTIRKGNKLLGKCCDHFDRMKLIHFLMTRLQIGDIIFEYGTKLFFSTLLIHLVHLKKAFYLRELCELPYGTLKESKLTRINRYISNHFQFRLYDGIITISSSLFDYAKKYASTKCKIIKIPILVEYEQYAMENRYREASFPYIFHSGTLFEQKDGFVGMLKAFAELSRDLSELKFVSTGKLDKSPHKNEILKIIGDYSLADRVIFLGFVNEVQLKDYLQKSLLVIINKYPTLQNKYCFSTKLAEYMAASKPIIITDVGEASNWLLHGKDAYIIKHGDVKSLSDAILDCYEHIDDTVKMGQMAQQTCKQYFDYKVYSVKLKQYLESFQKL